MNGKLPFKKPIVVIEWQDAYTCSDEEDPKFKDAKNHYTLSFGVIVDEDKDFYHVSHFFDGISNSFQDPFTSIPKGVVKSIKKLKATNGLHSKKRRSS